MIVSGKTMIAYEEALETVLAHSPKPSLRKVSLEESLGMVLMDTVVADIPMPPFNRSAVDGYALPGEGSSFPLEPEITASPGLPEPLGPGRAAPVMTGAPVPPGADRVVMIEHTGVEGNTLTVHRQPSPRENICFQGEDIPRGSVVLNPGALMTPAALGVAAMAGRNMISVAAGPGVALMTTGDEVIPHERVPGPGEVRNANGILGSSILRAAGFPPVSLIHSPDSPPALEEAAEASLKGADLLLIAGGVSMGSRDFVPGVMKDIGFDFLFEGVAQKPGKPLCFAVRDGQAFFGLPGNPVSVMVALEEYVVPYLRKASGYRRWRKRMLTGTLCREVGKKTGRTQFYRAIASRDGDRYRVEVPSTRGSGDLMSAVAVNCLMVLPPDTSRVFSGDEAPFSFLGALYGETAYDG